MPNETQVELYTKCLYINFMQQFRKFFQCINADTKLKLIASRTAKTTTNAFIDSSLGISYITLFVKDAGLTLANLKKHNIKVTAKGPVDLTPVGFQPNFLIVIQDPDGNFIEFVGPILTK